LDPRAFCTSTRVLIVAGKGGVGKTTVSAAIAQMAADAGLRALLIEIEGRSGLTALFGGNGSLDYHERNLGPCVRARTLTPDDALIEYLDHHGMRRISKRLSRTGAVDIVATAAPGIKDILVLGKVKAIERDEPETDVIIVDAPAAGHALQFLQSAQGLLDAVRIGPIRNQAHDVAELLSDPIRTQVVLVTLPEETPVNEIVQTAYALEDKVGIKLGPVVVNALYPVLDGLDFDPEMAGIRLAPGEADALRRAATFRRRRQELQADQVARLAEALPLPQLRLPFVFADRLGPAELQSLAASLADEVAKL
jgi:anion-transporting  ArsA/GET3 family ATPase